MATCCCCCYSVCGQSTFYFIGSSVVSSRPIKSERIAAELFQHFHTTAAERVCVCSCWGLETFSQSANHRCAGVASSKWNVSKIKRAVKCVQTQFFSSSFYVFCFFFLTMKWVFAMACRIYILTLHRNAINAINAIVVSGQMPMRRCKIDSSNANRFAESSRRWVHWNSRNGVTVALPFAYTRQPTHSTRCASI